MVGLIDLRFVLKIKPKILFVGSFKAAGETGNVGGQMFACRTLINSHLSEKYEWVLIDSTASTNKSRSFRERLGGALKRILAFWGALRKEKDILGVLIFSSAGFSFKEKGLMALIAKVGFQKQVIFAPRSGLILEDIEQSSMNRWWIRLVLSKVNKVLCQGESWQAYYRNFVGGDSTKYVAIHNWIDANLYFQNAPKPINAPQGPLNILYLGWVTPNKGIHLVLQVADKMRNQNLRFVIAGDGDALEETQQQVEKQKLSNAFEFKGWVDLPGKLKCLQQADIFILPSYKEGYPNALMEAMASSIACIASNVGGIPDLLGQNTYGLLMQPGNAESLQEQLEKLITNPELRVQYGQKARERIAANNTIEVALEKFDALFGETIP